MGYPESTVLSREQVLVPTTAQTHPLGARGVLVDGRVYRYARAGATNLTKGYLVQSAVPGLWNNATLSYLSTAIMGTTGVGYLGSTGISSTWGFIPLVSTTGDTTLPIVTKNYFKEGYLWASGNNTECGQMVRIKEHAAAATSGMPLRVYFEESERFSEVVDTDSFISMCKNEYDQVVVAPVTLTSKPVGVPNVGVTKGDYFWLQTWGACPVKLSSAAVSILRNAYNSTTVEGTVDGATSSTAGTTAPSTSLGVFKVGEFMTYPITTTVFIASEYTLVHLTLAP